jgi:hypothetical protein
VILVVGGNARGVGKTTLVCHVIAAMPERRWVAVKVSGHPHDDGPKLPPRGPQPKATDRFLAAGAAEALLLRGAEGAREKLAELAASGADLIVESNRAAEWLSFDAYLFVLDEHAENPKPAERCHLAKATWVLPPRQDPPAALVEALRLRGPENRGSLEASPDAANHPRSKADGLIPPTQPPGRRS